MSNLIPENEKWEPDQKPALGWLLTSVGFLLFVGSIVPILIANQEGPNDVLFIIVGLGMFVGGAAMGIKGKRHLTRRAEDVLQEDKRDPIIYLRSFDEEADSFGFRSYFTAVKDLFTFRSTGIQISPWDPTLQTQLSMVMERIGPYIAIGRPGAKLPGTGAHRLYIADKDWKSRVSELLQRARLVVLRAGSSKGLQWEIEKIFEIVSPTKLMFILPLERRDYQAFRLFLEQQNVYLPHKRPNTLFMTLDKNLKPVFLKISGRLENTLSPYFLANNIAPPKSSMWDAVRLFFR